MTYSQMLRSPAWREVIIRPQQTAMAGTQLMATAYVGSFLVAMLLCWAPSKAIAYAAPALATVWYVIASRDPAILKRISLLALFCMVIIFFHTMLQPAFVLSNALLFTITYSSAVFLIVVPNSSLRAPGIVERLLRITRPVIVLEAIVGIVQAAHGYLESGTFDIANGDLAQGTIYPFFEIDGGFANPMFGASMSLLLLGLLAGLSMKKSSLGSLAVGTVAIVLASVVHQLTFMLAALVVAFLLIRPRLPLSRNALAVLILITLIPVMSVLLLPGNLSTFEIIANQFLSGESPRSVILGYVFGAMPDDYPYMTLAGLGPGQFSSRAALMGTGYYFGNPISARAVLPFLETRTPPPLEKYLIQLWLRNWGNKYYGSSQKPFFSWLSLYTELGAVFTLAIVTVLAVAIFRVYAASRMTNDRLNHFAVAAGIMFLGLLAFQENYWEVPQAIFPGCVLLKALYANCVTSTPAAKSFLR